jgi:carbon-monoxide dehydrogenase small subunit
MSVHQVRLEIDGERVSAEFGARTLLIQALRETFGVTGPHVGCETGRCGACTVLVDGRAAKACTILAVQVSGAQISTAAGLAQGQQLHPLQEAFHRAHALQCGFCTPGMLVAALELLRETVAPTEVEIRQALRGNLCRCTGYQHIVDAVADFATLALGS